MWLRSAGTTLILQLRSGGDHSDPGLAPAGNTLIRGVLFGSGGLRSGRNHSCPVGTTAITSLQLRDHSDSGFAVGSGGDHCDRELAVEVRRKERRTEGRSRADIKSNNPHPTGGEQDAFGACRLIFPDPKGGSWYGPIAGISSDI